MPIEVRHDVAPIWGALLAGMTGYNQQQVANMEMQREMDARRQAQQSAAIRGAFDDLAGGLQWGLQERNRDRRWQQQQKAEQDQYERQRADRNTDWLTRQEYSQQQADLNDPIGKRLRDNEMARLELIDSGEWQGPELEAALAELDKKDQRLLTMRNRGTSNQIRYETDPETGKRVAIYGGQWKWLDDPASSPRGQMTGNVSAGLRQDAEERARKMIADYEVPPNVTVQQVADALYTNWTQGTPLPEFLNTTAAAPPPPPDDRNWLQRGVDRLWPGQDAPGQGIDPATGSPALAARGQGGMMDSLGQLANQINPINAARTIGGAAAEWWNGSDGSGGVPVEQFTQAIASGADLQQLLADPNIAAAFNAMSEDEQRQIVAMVRQQAVAGR